MDWFVVRDGTTWPKKAESPTALPGATRRPKAAQAFSSASGSVKKGEPGEETCPSPPALCVCPDRVCPVLIYPSHTCTDALHQPGFKWQFKPFKATLKHPLGRFPLITGSRGVIG